MPPGLLGHQQHRLQDCRPDLVQPGVAFDSSIAHLRALCLLRQSEVLPQSPALLGVALMLRMISSSDGRRSATYKVSISIRKDRHPVYPPALSVMPDNRLSNVRLLLSMRRCSGIDSVDQTSIGASRTSELPVPSQVAHIQAQDRQRTHTSFAVFARSCERRAAAV